MDDKGPCCFDMARFTLLDRRKFLPSLAVDLLAQILGFGLLTDR